LFPDLDGLSEYVNWFMANRDHWKEPPAVTETEEAAARQSDINFDVLFGD
jgi:hypothetical protein